MQRSHASYVKGLIKRKFGQTFILGRDHRSKICQFQSNGGFVFKIPLKLEGITILKLAIHLYLTMSDCKIKQLPIILHIIL